MRKILSTLLLASAITLVGNYTLAQDVQPTTSPEQMTPQKCEQCRKARIKQFEQRLNLTEKQKEKAHQIHLQAREEIKPIIKQIEDKKQEIETVKLSRISERMQKERIDELNLEIQKLEKQAQEIRKVNTEEFEKILNKKQKEELKVIKSEGRAKYEQYHKARTPFQSITQPVLKLTPAVPILPAETK